MSTPLKLLLPLDFSECSRMALRQCVRLVRQAPATVELLHVWEPMPAMTSEAVALESSVASELEQSAASRAQDQLLESQRELADEGIVVHTTIQRGGRPSEVIVEVARRLKTDLIVMGTHGRSGFERALLGSVVERVLRHSSCPVLSVGPASASAELREIRRILAAIDFSENSRHAVRWSSDLARLLGASVEVVHVWDRPQWFQNQLQVKFDGVERPLGELVHENTQADLEAFARETLADSGSTPECRLLSGNPGRELLAEIEGGRYDLVVIGTHGRGGLGHLLLGSLAEKLVRLASKPVITVPHLSAARLAAAAE